MFTTMMWIWINIFALFINKMGMNIFPNKKELRILMYFIFPLVFFIEVLPYILQGSKGKLETRAAIWFINLLDKLRGDYK